MSVTSQVIMLFLVALVGTASRKLGYLNDETIKGVTKLVVNITVPCLMISNMQRPFDVQVLKNFLITLGLSSAFILLPILAGLMLFSRRDQKRRAALANLLGFSNCGFMGYPIILAVNPDWMIYAVAYNIAFIFVCWTMGVSLFRRDKGVELRRVLLNPNLIAALIGFTLFCLSVTLPAVLTEVLSMVGGLTTPLTMLLIGTRMIGLRPAEFKNRDYHFTAALRLVIIPLALYGMLLLTPLPAAVKGVMFLLTAMPSGSTTSMLAELYDKDADFAARGVAYTTLLSLVTIPLMCQLI